MKKLFLLMIFTLTTSLFANSLAEIKQSKHIRIGVYKDNPPFAKLQDDEFQGFEIDLSNVIVKNLFENSSGNVEFIVLDGAKERIPALEENKVDMVVAIFTITAERQKILDFAMPYFSVNLGVLTRKGENLKKLSDFKDKKMIVKKATTAMKYFENQGIETIGCDTNKDCYEKLKANKGDGWGADNLVVFAYPIIDEEVEVNIKNIGATEFLGIAVQKGNKELLNFINDEMIKLSKKGFFKEAYDNTFEPFYKGTINKKYFLLDDLYNSFF